MTATRVAPGVRPLPALDGGDSPTVAAAAAHQVRAPLSSLRLRLETLQERLAAGTNAHARREVGAILHEVDRLSRILEQVLTWGSAAEPRAPAEPVDALGIAAARVDAWAPLARSRGIRLELDGIAVTGLEAGGALEQSLDVFLDNALHHAPGGSEVRVVVDERGPEIEVRVRDRGPGMTDEEIARAGTPFWRGSSARDHAGTGLGLTIAAALLTASGGRLELSRADGGGLYAAAVLPAAL
ncbi:sensor histidine kinase [Streptomyces sp. NPDC059371]|uniref:sensor histidine kinase n=1 Tax=Streptomyces sp. NPDC059371 TaxID=3346812 RepID=UPI0036A928CB